jgi:hypothetical protein
VTTTPPSSALEQNRNGGIETAWQRTPKASISDSRTATSYWDRASGSGAPGPTPLTLGSSSTISWAAPERSASPRSANHCSRGSGGGDIVKVGSAVTDRRVGRRVVIEPNYCDLTCVECRAGHSSACLNRVVLAINTPGILAERVAAPAEFTWPISTDWPDVALACFEPLCVADTAVRRASVPAGAECLVIGAGSQGQLVCQSLLAGGAVPYVTEPHPGRMELALKFGARRDLRAQRVGADNQRPQSIRDV